MRLIAKRPCSFGGRDFFIDDEIPVEFVANPKVQEQYGTIMVLYDEESPEALLSEVSAMPTDAVIVPIILHEDVEDAQGMGVPLNPTEVNHVFKIMQMAVSEAEKEVSGISNTNELIVLHACDSRKTVKTAARKRAAQLPDQGEDVVEVEENL